MPIPLIAGLAGLALSAGPSLIRGLASLVGGNETADKVANIVQTVSELGLGKSDSQAMIESRLQQAFTPEQFVELQRLKADLEREPFALAAVRRGDAGHRDGDDALRSLCAARGGRLSHFHAARRSDSASCGR